ncbi:protein NRT1/ PTR FAMILY 2.13-like isoform X2 [Asparagus officinalis]|uniref:protein NRT1/ PTR FAMILY 2.13-like isoform X2 n=1 Tax=Asparagus officinalis TaxID=4686 RepID=UPI00098E1CF5|nr:protein NRT1/ PTR FAMILY 2.13-like isoform X2 [Asparagus officinalis]
MKKSLFFSPLFYYLRCAQPSSSSNSKEAEKEEDLKTEAEKRRPRGWKCMPYIIGNETFEKVASVGLLSNFTVYLVKEFKMQQVSAANLANIFFGTTNFAPLLGAFVSDAYWGRFRTLAYSSIASFIGMLTMTLSASIPQLKPSDCSEADQSAGHCKGPSDLQYSILFLALGLLAVGAGGVRPCSLPFGVDQFDRTTEKGQRGLNSFFNWYYFTSTAAMVTSMTFIVYIQNSVSWPIGFAIPTGFMLLSVVAFFLGTKLYVYVAPEGSVFSSIAQVFVAAFKKRKLQVPSPDDVLSQESRLYCPFNRSENVSKLPLTLQFRSLNKAAVVCDGELNPEGNPVNPWRLCSVQQIEEVKCLIRIIPIWASGITCFVALVQQFTFAILQALTMDRHLGPHFQIPAGSLATISMLALTLFIPVYDRILIPIVRRFTKIESGITLLQRQGVGIFISVLSMIVAALIEQKRRISAVSHGGTSPLSVLWLVPQLVLMGIAEAFNAIGQIEFYNRQFPEHMQTLAGSLFFCSLAGASYLSTFVVTIVQKITEEGGRTSWLDNDINKGRVDYFYYVIAIMGVCNLFYFLVCSHYYRYKGTGGHEVKEETRKEVELP